MSERIKGLQGVILEKTPLSQEDFRDKMARWEEERVETEKFFRRLRHERKTRTQRNKR